MTCDVVVLSPLAVVVRDRIRAGEFPAGDDDALTRLIAALAQLPLPVAYALVVEVEQAWGLS